MSRRSQQHSGFDHENRIIILLIGFLSLSVVLHIISMEWFHLDPPMSHFQATSLIQSASSSNQASDIAPFRSEDGKPFLRSYEDILKAAGVEMTDEIRSSLPPISDLVEMYGSEPVIIGLEKCEEFRGKYGPKEAVIAPAGMFNTGTNLLHALLQNNCEISEKKRNKSYILGGKNPFLRYQVPWGKHQPVSWRFQHVAPTFEGVNQEAFLPGLVIKDPYTWMDSMCRHKYAANWAHFKDHCPNLVPITEKERVAVKQRGGNGSTVTVNVHYHDDPNKITKHSSMVDLWNTYYGDWLKTDFPKIVIRFEDLLVHAETVVEKLCTCAGGTLKPGPFKYEQESVKEKQGLKVHAGSNGLIQSIQKYGSIGRRVKMYTPQDLDFAKNELDKDLMKMFRYTEPSHIVGKKFSHHT